MGTKGIQKRKPRHKKQLLIDKMIVKDCKKWLTSLAVAWIDYDVVSHNWIQKWVEVFGVGVNVRTFVNASMKQWNIEMTAGNQRLEM